MSLNTYPELKTAIADWMERGDLAARAGDFVALAESRLNRLLRSPALEREATVTVAQGERTAAAPPDLREPLRLWLDGEGQASVLPYRDAGDLPREGAAGLPRAWTLDGGRIRLDRPTDRTCSLTLRYLGRLGLSEDAPVNPILADYPDLYLFGSLVEAAPYLRDAEMLSLFLARFEAALDEARAKDGRRHSLAALRVEPGLADAWPLVGP